MPGGEHEPQLLWRPHHQQLQLLLRLGRAQLVQVVDHEIDPVLQRRQILQQPLGDRPPVQVRRRRQRLHQHQPRGRLAQRVEHRQPELLRIPLAAPDRHPRGAARRARLADPRSQQDRLPAARRGRYHGHAGRRPEPLEQPGTGNDTSRTRTRDATGNGVRSGSRSHVPDHRTTPAHMVQIPDAETLTAPCARNCPASRPATSTASHHARRTPPSAPLLGHLILIPKPRVTAGRRAFSPTFCVTQRDVVPAVAAGSGTMPTW